MNKKGNIMLILVFFLILFVILFVGFMMVMGSSILNLVFDEVLPELTNMGDIGGVDMTHASQVSIVPLNTLIQSFTWLTGVFFIMMLVGSIGIVFVARETPSRWLIGFYFGLVVLLIITTIFMSNIYQDFYDSNDDLAVRLKEHFILSYMLLYAPIFFTVIAFVTGIILFSGMKQEEFV